MTVVILAAGKGERLKPITNTIPKPLIKVQGVTIIKRLLVTLPEMVDKVIIVIGYKGNMIKKEIGRVFNGKKIQYVCQKKNCSGTMCALISAKRYLVNNFIVICSDNIYCKSDLEKLVHQEFSYLAMKISKKDKKVYYPYAKYSIFSKLKRKLILDLGAWHLNTSIFEEVPYILEQNFELSIPHTVKRYCETNNIIIKPIFSNYWLPVGNISELINANSILSRKQDNSL